MKPTPIKTEADHDTAVARIFDLMGSTPGTPESEELDALATLVDAWESIHTPIDPPRKRKSRNPATFNL